MRGILVNSPQELTFDQNLINLSEINELNYGIIFLGKEFKYKVKGK